MLIIMQHNAEGAAAIGQGQSQIAISPLRTADRYRPMKVASPDNMIVCKIPGVLATNFALVKGDAEVQL